MLPVVRPQQQRSIGPEHPDPDEAEHSGTGVPHGTSLLDAQGVPQQAGNGDEHGDQGQGGFASPVRGEHHPADADDAQQLGGVHAGVAQLAVELRATGRHRQRTQHHQSPAPDGVGDAEEDQQSDADGDRRTQVATSPSDG